MVDVWDYPYAAWRARIENHIKPLVIAARAAGCKIIHANHGGPIYPHGLWAASDIIMTGDLIMTDQQVHAEKLANVMVANAITVALYAGFALNRCLSPAGRPAGVHWVDWYLQRRPSGPYTPKYVLVEECAAAIERAGVGAPPPEIGPHHVSHLDDWRCAAGGRSFTCNRAAISF